jgi:LytS/YehU family sensor histidine kinase
MPVSSELAIIREYLAIEKVRLGDRLAFEIEEPVWSQERHVPTLMLQTLVENAIKHGIAPSIEGGRIRVWFRDLDDGLYECNVLNSGMPLKRTAESGGTGLLNSEERLRQLYGENGKLSLRTETEGTRASFSFTGEALAQDLGR